MMLKGASTNAANRAGREKHGGGKEHAAKHNAEQGKRHKVVVEGKRAHRRQNDAAGNYVDKFGKVWRFLGKARDEEELRQLCQQNWLTKGATYKLTIRFYCRRHRWHHCKFCAIYEKQSGTLFVRGQHDHSLVDRRIIGPGDNYVDRFGREWRFIEKIANEQKLTHFCQQNWLRIWCKTKNRLFFICKRGNGVRKGPRYCQLRVLFNKQNSNLYFRSNHNHSMPVLLRREKALNGDQDEKEGEKENEEEEEEKEEDGWEEEGDEEEEEESEEKDEEEVEEQYDGKKKDEEGEVEDEEGEEDEMEIEEEEKDEDGQEKDESLNNHEFGAGGQMELEIIEEISQDRKWVRHMKMEGGEQRVVKVWPTVTIEDEEEEDAPTRRPNRKNGQKNHMAVKKEEPAEQIDQVPGAAANNGQPRDQQPPANRQPPPRKILLRERKRAINYAE